MLIVHFGGLCVAEDQIRLSLFFDRRFFACYRCLVRHLLALHWFGLFARHAEPTVFNQQQFVRWTSFGRITSVVPCADSGFISFLCPFGAFGCRLPR